MSRLVEIRLTKCTVFLTEQELRHLLSRDPQLYAEALRRGKFILRARKEEARLQGGGTSAKADN